MSDIINREVHPDWYYDIPVMKTLILGSYPPHPKRYNYQFYYPHKRNHFWKVLASIAEAELKHFEGEAAVKERHQIMRSLETGVENMGQIIDRKGRSAADSDITIIEFRKIKQIVETHPELDQILLPGYDKESSTTKSFLRYLTEQDIKFDMPKIFKPHEKFIVYLDDKKIECVILNSTSPAKFRTPDPLIEQFSVYYPNYKK